MGRAILQLERIGHHPYVDLNFVRSAAPIGRDDLRLLTLLGLVLLLRSYLRERTYTIHKLI
jgi:hypothetical protein